MSDLDTALSPPPPEGVDPRYDRLIEAIGKCVTTCGFEDLSIDDVTAVSGLSRATLYRRFGSRDGMLKAYLDRRSSILIETGRRIADEPGELGERLESILTLMVHSMNRTPWIQREYLAGLSPTVAQLVHDALARFFDAVITPMFARSEAQGDWQRPAPLPELIGWLTDEYFVLVRLRAHDEDEVRRHIRTYILPVLNLRKSGCDVHALSAKIEALQKELATFSDLLKTRSGA